MRLLIVLALACSGCSMLFMEPLEDNWTHTREPRCTETSGFAAWDMALALVDGSVGAVGLYAFRDSEGEEDYEKVRPTFGVMALVGFVGLAVHGTSAVVGFRRSDRCAAARAKRDRYLEWREETIRRQRAHPEQPTYRVEPVPREELERDETETPPGMNTPATPASDAGPP